MPKKDYSRIEDNVERSAEEHRRRKILEEASRVIEDSERGVALVKRRVPGMAAREAVLSAILKQLRFIREHSPDDFARIIELRKSCKQLSERLQDLSIEDWDLLLKHKLRLNRLRVKLLSDKEGHYDDEIVEKELKRLKKKGRYHFDAKEHWDTI